MSKTTTTDTVAKTIPGAGKATETEPKAAPKIKSVILKEAYKMPEEMSYAQIGYKGTKSIEFYGPYCIMVDSKYVIPLSNVKGIDLI